MMDIKEILHKKGELTEAEYAALDEYFTVNTIFPTGGKAGYFARNYGMPIYLDIETLEHLDKLAGNTHIPPAELIGDLVRERISALA
jgi:hypothetical protein